MLLGRLPPSLYSDRLVGQGDYFISQPERSNQKTCFHNRKFLKIVLSARHSDNDDHLLQKVGKPGGKVHRRQLGNPGSLRPSLKKNHGEFGHVGHDTSSGTNETTSEDESSRKTINNCCLTTAYCLGLVLVSLKEKDIGRLRHRGMSNGNMKDSSMLVPLFHAPEIHKKQNKSFWGNITADETSSSMYQQCKDVCLRCHL